MAPTILWIGLGNMGRGMTKNLVEKGGLDQPLLLYNRSKERAVELAAKLPEGKTVVVDSIADGVARADIIFTSLAHDAAVRSTVEAIVQSGHSLSGKLVVEASTIHPDTTQAAADTINATGADFVACPVFGAPAMAETGQLVPVLAGPREAVDRCRPYWKGVMARAVIDLSGEPYGRATTLKLIGNTFILNMVEQLAEAHVLAEKTGLGTAPVHAFVEAVMPGVYAAYSTRMLSGDYYTRQAPLFNSDLARKDAAHALALARSAGTKLPNVEAADAHLAKVTEHMGQRGDLSGIYGAARAEAGLKFENDVEERSDPAA